MPITPTAKRILITAGALILIAGGIFLATVPILLERWINQYDLQRAFNEASGGTISTGTISLRVFPAPHLIIPTGKIDLPDYVSGSWREIRIHPALKSILSGQIQFQKIGIIEPDVQLKVTPAPEAGEQAPMGHLTSDYLHKRLTAVVLQMGGGMQWLVTHAPEARVQIRQGRLSLPADQSAPPLSFHAIDAQLTLPPDRLQIELDCKSSMLRTLRVAGSVDASTLSGQLTLWFNNLDAEQLSGMVGPNRLTDRIEGMLSGHMTVDLKGPSKIESHISFRLPRLSLQRLETPVTVHNVFLDGTVLFDETTLRFDLDRLYAEQPRLNLTGHVQVGGDFSGLRIHLVGSRIDVAEARAATLALVGDNERTVKIFDVLRAGNVPWISWRTEGPRIGDLGKFSNMKLTGEMQDGELYIPAADLKLTDVNGIADIADGVLRGESLSAREQTTTGRDGKLWMDFGPDDLPFFLEIDTHLKDVGHLPPLLLKWVDNAAFTNELQQLHQVNGEARGIMILDSRKGEGLEVTADVEQFRLAARYDRIPWEVQIDNGQVLYTNDRISLNQMNGRIGASTFNNLKARVDFGGEYWLQIDSVRAAADLEAVLPWLMSFEALESRAGQYRVEGDAAEIARLTLQGPFFEPSRWTFQTQGHINQLQVTADHLPGPLNFSDLQIQADERSLIADKASLQVLDANIAGSARTAFASYRLQSFGIQFKGVIGEKADKWLNDLFEEDADFYLTQTPLDLSAATISWSTDGPFYVHGDFTTSKDVRVLLSEEWQEAYRKQRVEIRDGEMVATISRHRQPDALAFTFEGILTGKTLDRLLLNNPFPSGRLKGDFRVAIVPERPERSTVNGHLTAANIRLPLEIDHRIHLSQLRLTAENNRLDIASAAFLVDDSWHTLEGHIRTASHRYHVDLRHEGAYFAIPPSEDPRTEDDRTRLERMLNLPIDGKIQSRLSALKWGEQRWVPMKTTTSLTPGQWTIELDEAGLCGVQTTGTVVLATEKIAVDLHHHAENASLNPTISCLLGKPDLIDGRFDLDGRLAGAAPLETIDRALEGQFKFQAEDGRIYRFDLLGRILATINLTELVRGQKSDLMGEGLAYRQIEIEAQLADSQLTLDKAIIDGASAEIAARGSLDLHADEIDLIVLVAPLKTIDAIVKFTPIINTWLEGTLLSIPVKVSGRFDDPSITPMAPSAVGSSILNLLKNTVKLPVRLVEPLLEDDEDENEENPSP